MIGAAFVSILGNLRGRIRGKAEVGCFRSRNDGRVKYQKWLYRFI
jgi:hypothetical protein